jgi:hypothetical protein
MGQSKPAETPDDLPPIPMPPDVREYVVNKLTEILVLDYYHFHGPASTDGAPPPQRGQP